MNEPLIGPRSDDPKRERQEQELRTRENTPLYHLLAASPAGVIKPDDAQKARNDINALLSRADTAPAVLECLDKTDAEARTILEGLLGKNN